MVDGGSRKPEARKEGMVMWSAILDVAGWAMFYFLLIYFVRWIAIERAFFAGQDPGRWEQKPSAPKACLRSLRRFSVSARPL
jgi:hypothetical protein